MSQAAPASQVMQEFDNEFLLNAPEIYIFSACRHIIELIATARKAAGTHRKDWFNEQVAHLFAQLSALAQASQRFDIVMPFTPESGFSPFFWSWYNWWHDYREHLTADELDLVHRLQDTFDPAALAYRPPGDWLWYRSTPPFRFKIPTLAKRKASKSQAARAKA
jgi:hypothetical protein